MNTWILFLIVGILIIIGLVYIFTKSSSNFKNTKYVNKDGYFKHLPSVKKHPNSKKELSKVYQAIKSRTKKDEYFFSLTDVDLYKPFQQLLKQNGYNYSEKELNSILQEPHKKIIGLKKYYNRIRPYQLDKNIDMLKTKTGYTPSYPAGHAYQAYYLSKHLYKKHSALKQQLLEISDRIDKTRVMGGIHYPSDGKFSRKLVLGH